jgi:hypothetical protein
MHQQYLWRHKAEVLARLGAQRKEVDRVHITTATPYHAFLCLMASNTAPLYAPVTSVQPLRGSYPFVFTFFSSCFCCCCLFVCFSLVLGWGGCVSEIWTPGLVLARWRSTTWAVPPALFCFSYFSGRVSHFLPRAGLRWYPLTYNSHMAGIIAMSYHTQPSSCISTFLVLTSFFPFS